MKRSVEEGKYFKSPDKFLSGNWIEGMTAQR
jgi:hypothetical protein